MPLVMLLALSHVSYHVSGCQSRSGEDTERVYSHQGTEPNFEKEAEVETGETDQDDDSKIRETGEIKVYHITNLIFYAWNMNNRLAPSGSSQ